MKVSVLNCLKKSKPDVEKGVLNDLSIIFLSNVKKMILSIILYVGICTLTSHFDIIYKKKQKHQLIVLLKIVILDARTYNAKCQAHLQDMEPIAIGENVVKTVTLLILD